jgi:organic radical activating enzyme
MLNGVEPDACKRCYDDERMGLRSKRIEENERYFSHDIAHNTQDDGSISLDFEFIELRLGNVCNLRCRTCNPASSTKWIRDHKMLENKLSFVTKYGNVERGTWYESDTFWEDLLNNSKNVKRIYINGGEPTLIKKHFSYLERLIETGLNKNIELWYNLNLTNVDDELLEYWKQFKKCTISASIDDLGERNEYIRTNSVWHTTLENLRKLKNESWIELSVVQTVSLYNIEHVDEFYEFMVHQEKIPVHINWVYDPVFQQAWHLEDEKKYAIIKKCRDTMYEWDFENVKNHLLKPRIEGMLEKFSTFNKVLDEHV